MAPPTTATCGDCHRVCKSRGALRAHQRCHNKTYFCYDGQCSRKRAPVAFASEKDLKRHQRTHTTTPKIQCHYCHAVVGRADNLKRHISTVHKGGICMAAASGDEEAVMSCLIDPRFAHQKDGNGDTPLCLAAANGHEGVVRILLDLIDAGVGMECPVDDPRPAALWLARVHERHDVAMLLISRGAAIDPQNGIRPQALFQGVKERDIHLVRRCIEAGVAIDLDVPDSIGPTALRWAVENGDGEMTKLLISNGATVHGTSLLVAAARLGHAGVFNVLLENTLKITNYNLRGILAHPESQHGDILKLAVRKWLEVEKSCWMRGTALEDAAAQGLEVAVRVLLDNGDYIGSIGAQAGQNALTRAARWGHVEVMRFLLKRRTDLDGGDSKGRNALHQAAFGGHSEAVRFLLDGGAGIDVVDRRGKNALHFAAGHGSLEIVQLLMERGAEIDVVDERGQNALHCAATNGRLDVVRLLLERGAGIDVVDRRGKNALRCAAGHGRLEVVRLLMERGAEIDVVDDGGQNALHCAAGYGHLEIVRLLLARGAEIDVVTNKGGRSALHCATRHGHLEVIQLLIEQGAEIDMVNKGGQSALHYAARYGDLAVARLLLERGANQQARDKLGRTPSQLVDRSNHRLRHILK